ncbi:MAG: hypothetical protein ACRDHY_13755 [Anaerolineales bacterium]
MIERVKLGTVPAGPGRMLEVFRCRSGEDWWVELYETVLDPDSDERFLLSASEARALAAILVQAAEDPPPTGFYKPA